MNNSGYLEAMALIEYALDTVKAGKRAQIPKSKLSDLNSVLLQIYKKLGVDATATPILVPLNDLLKSIEVTQKMNITMITESIRESLTKGLLEIKSNIAKLCYNYYTEHDFDVTPEIIQVMREVVKCEYGG